MNSARQRDRRLATLERLHEAELEQARVERTRLDAAVESQVKAVSDIERELASTTSLMREQVADGAGVPADLLRLTCDYARWQARTLAGQQALLVKARTSAEEGRQHVLRRFERLATIERLRVRAARENEIERARAEQKALDDQALLRPGAAV